MDPPFAVDQKKVNDVVQGLKRLAGPKRRVCAIMDDVMRKILDCGELNTEEVMCCGMTYTYLARM